MTLIERTPSVDELPDVADLLSTWQVDPWPGHLHPGDLGWHSTAGAEQTAAHLRVWHRDGGPVAMGLLDGSAVVRLAVTPALADDDDLADDLCAALSALDTALFDGGRPIVEARGATALRAALRASGWVDDASWTPLALDLAALDTARLDRSDLRVEEVGPESAEEYMRVHWSAFRGTAFDEEARRRSVPRLRSLMTGPFADRSRSLVARDPDGTPVAVTTVWFAGTGRPGLVEPLAVRSDHAGRGYGVAMTLAGARVLADLGASTVAVATEDARPVAVATYRSAGFVTAGPVTDLRRA